MKILLLDDDRELRPMLTQFLERSGHEVTPCSKGITAIRAVLDVEEKLERFDVYILDCALPKFDGFTVAQIIRLIESVRTNIKGARLAMLTGKMRTVEDAHLLDSINYDAYWTKPLGMDEIEGKLKEWQCDAAAQTEK